MALMQMLTRRGTTAATAVSRAAFSSSSRVFPSFMTYGSDAAFQVSPVAPQYTSTPTYLKTKRVGAVMLSWAKANNGGYNYNNKAFFSLSPSEVGLVLELLDSRINEISLSHSPNVNATDEDKTKRVLEVTRTSTPEGQPAILFKIVGEIQAAVSLNMGETRVLKELLAYSLPRLFGFHSVLEGPLNVDGPGSSGNSNGRSAISGGNRSNNAKPAAEWPF